MNETSTIIYAENVTEDDEITTTWLGADASDEMIWAIVDVVLFVVIIFGNVLTIMAIILTRSLRNTISNYFVCSLAVSDSLVGLTLPYHLAFYICPDLNKTKITCILRFVLISLACCASIYNLIAIAIDRYISIVHPFQYNRCMNKRIAYAILALGWVIAIYVGTIPVYWNCFDVAQECEMETVLPRYYTAAVLTPMLLVVWIVMFLLYWRIWREATTHARRLRDNSFDNDGPSDWKSVQVVLLVLGCFSICWLPYLIVACSRAFDSKKETSAIIYKALFSLAMANSGMNPLIYVWKNTKYRAAIVRLLYLQLPNRTDYNNSLKEYSRKKNAQHENGTSRGVRTICDNYSFQVEEEPPPALQRVTAV